MTLYLFFQIVTHDLCCNGCDINKIKDKLIRFLPTHCTCTSNNNSIGGVMDSVLASSVVDRGFDTNQVKPKTIKLACVAFPLSTQH